MTTPDLDPRIAAYATKVFDPNNPKCQTDLAELARMIGTPVNGPLDLKAPNVTLKALFPQIMRDESLIDYKKDNDTPLMQGRSSTVEWAAFAWAAARHGIPLKLDGNQGPELSEAVLKSIIEEGAKIHQGYTAMKEFDAKITNPQVEKKPAQTR